MTESQIKRREALAEAYSETQFNNADSFSVMKGVCNDYVYVESFSAGYNAAFADASVLVDCLERLNVQAIVNGIEGQADVSRKIGEALSAWRD